MIIFLFCVFVILEQLDVLWSLDLVQIFCATIGIHELPRNIFTPNGLVLFFQINLLYLINCIYTISY